MLAAEYEETDVMRAAMNRASMFSSSTAMTLTA
jgi:hypothetical protein